MFLFITFEGREGSGKSIQAKLLYRKLSKLTVPEVLIDESGVTSIGKKVACWLKWG